MPSLGLLLRLEPERGQLRDLGGRPAQRQTQKVAQVAQRLDAVQPAAGQHRDPEGLTWAPWSLPQNSQLRRPTS